MVKIEQLKMAKAVFIRNNNEQPVILNSTLTDEEFKTLRVLEGIVVVSINESEVLSIAAESKSSNIVIQDEVKTITETKSEIEPALVTASEEIKVTETVKPVIVKPVPRTRK